MAHEIEAGTILIRDDAPLPKELVFDSEPYIAGWRVVTNLDGYALERAIRKAGWNFFYRAGEIKTTVFGIDRQKTMRRAIGQMAVSRSGNYNSLEIARVIVAGSERFPLVHYVTVSVRLRHIQQSPFLFGAAETPQFDAEKRDICADVPGLARDGVFQLEGARRDPV